MSSNNQESSIYPKSNSNSNSELNSQSEIQLYNPVLDNEDAQSELSNINSRTSSINKYQTNPGDRIKLMKTETVKTLAQIGVTSITPVPDVNAPTSLRNPIFPEEYTLETETGLVPVVTLTSIGRINVNQLNKNISRTRTGTRARANSGFTNQPYFPTYHEYAEKTHSKTSSTKHSLKIPSKVPTNIPATALESDNEEEKPSIDHERNDSNPDETPEIDPEVEFVTFVINDSENPHNWSLFSRWCYTLIFSVAVISVAFGSACTSGGLLLVNEKYNVSTEVSILTVSLMVLGFAFGPLIWSPLSEKIGRKWVYFISLGLYTIFNIPCALSPNIGGLLVCRFLCGVFSSSALCLAGASIADMFPTASRGLAIAYFAFSPYSGACFGPLVSGWIAVGSGRLELFFWVNMAFAGVLWIVSSLIPETYAPVILKKRAQRLREETNNPKIMTEQEAQGLSLKEIIKTCLIRPLYFTITEPVLDLMCFYVCLIYSLLYAFFFAYPVIFGELYGYNDGQIGLMFIPILIGAGFALLTTPILEKFYMKTSKVRIMTPEDRLVGAMVGSPFPAIALFILGATSFKHIIWVGPASSGIAFGYGMVLIYYSINNYIIDTYSLYSASALATKVFLRSAGGAAFPLFTTQMYNGLGLQWASWLLAFVSTAMILIPFVFHRYGAKLREKLCKENYSIQQ
ncbi:MFS transporter [Ascoidea rubescens DSM 1968]|uniref:Polyamine transport protein specific for spermine n=1 Tax=Ascoidea rubescens DSM 1968 TaxID=1344418 RepID=A0A1D2VRV4_9ASCO|nr:polyamine transport protein specific for spermine [Ascoidea rubescens DSM 1968]ODV64318.1 polyamine transport protein specific for spermine [Ascoidea rubescens DSM 1968]